MTEQSTLYKTQLCRIVPCPRGARCTYAHKKDELRCYFFARDGSCPDERCDRIHIDKRDKIVYPHGRSKDQSRTSATLSTEKPKKVSKFAVSRAGIRPKTSAWSKLPSATPGKTPGGPRIREASDDSMDHWCEARAKKAEKSRISKKPKKIPERKIKETSDPPPRMKVKKDVIKDTDDASVVGEGFDIDFYRQAFADERIGRRQCSYETSETRERTPALKTTPVRLRGGFSKMKDPMPPSTYVCGERARYMCDSELQIEGGEPGATLSPSVSIASEKSTQSMRTYSFKVEAVYTFSTEKECDKARKYVEKMLQMPNAVVHIAFPDELS